jgi:Tol biopolymer transport system component
MLLFLLLFLQSCSQPEKGDLKNTESLAPVKTALLSTPGPEKPSPKVTNSPTQLKWEKPALTSTKSPSRPEQTAKPTQPKISFEKLKSVPPGEYFFYSNDEGLAISSVTDKTKYFLAPILDDYPSISPDKKFVAYVIQGLPYIYDIEKNQEIKLRPPYTTCILPSWSPDSKKVIFSCTHQKGGEDLFVYFISDFSYKKITNCEATNDFCTSAAWSPDGKKIAYTRHPAYSGEAAYTGMYLMDSKCIEADDCLVKGPQTYFTVFNWSPDGKKFAGISRGKLFLYDYGDGNFSNGHLLGTFDEQFMLIWSPDNKFLAFGSQAVIISLETKKLQKISIPDSARLKGWIKLP